MPGFALEFAKPAELVEPEPEPEPEPELCAGGCDPDCFGVRVRGDNDMFSCSHVLISSLSRVVTFSCG